jgi:two-component system NtrC family response regulator
MAYTFKSRSAASVTLLRTNGDDILRLARHFIRVINARTPRAVEGLDASAERALLEHGWPGNVRELENVVRSAALFADGAQWKGLDPAQVDTGADCGGKSVG